MEQASRPLLELAVLVETLLGNLRAQLELDPREGSVWFSDWSRPVILTAESADSHAYIVPSPSVIRRKGMESNHRGTCAPASD